MLQFILGKNGVGKTTYIYNSIKKLAESKNENIIMLVPDQITFETEKAFLDILGARKSKNVKVFGFSRFCNYIFECDPFVRTISMFVNWTYFNSGFAVACCSTGVI